MSESKSFVAAPYIKEIGRGKQGARNLDRDQAAALYTAMLERRLSDLELGAILLAMRIKGESAEELTGFLRAAHAHCEKISTAKSEFAPIVIPSYNGARKKLNLTPLLAGLLARAGAPVLVHGVMQDVGRVCSAEIFQALDWPVLQSVTQFDACQTNRLPAFMPVSVLSPQLADLLNLRRVLGVRNSTHTVVKLLQPFLSPALRLFSYTHPEYLALMREFLPDYLTPMQGDLLLMRATEGEVVANVERCQQIDRYSSGFSETLAPKQVQMSESVFNLPASFDAQTTAVWIRAVLNDEIPVPENLQMQVALCLDISRQIQLRTRDELKHT